MWCNRIFPAKYARIRSPLSISTRKSVFGSASATTPGTDSIALLIQANSPNIPNRILKVKKLAIAH